MSTQFSETIAIPMLAHRCRFDGRRSDEGLRQVFDDRAGDSRDVASVRRRAQKNDEFIAARSRDEVGQRRRGEQAFGDRAGAIYRPPHDPTCH